MTMSIENLFFLTGILWSGKFRRNGYWQGKIVYVSRVSFKLSVGERGFFEVRSFFRRRDLRMVVAMVMNQHNASGRVKNQCCAVSDSVPGFVVQAMGREHIMSGNAATINANINVHHQSAVAANSQPDHRGRPIQSISDTGHKQNRRSGHYGRAGPRTNPMERRDALLRGRELTARERLAGQRRNCCRGRSFSGQAFPPGRGESGTSD